MGGFISFIWMGSRCRHLPRRGSGGPEVEAPRTRAPAPRCSRPGGCECGPGRTGGRQAGGSPGSRRGRPGPALLSGVAVGPGPHAAQPALGARSRRSRPDRSAGGGRGPRVTGPGRGRRRGEPAGSPAVGAGSAEDQASGGLNASRVRLIIKLIKGSI